MPHFILLGRDRPGCSGLRARLREEHLAGLRKLSDAGRLVVAGPMRDGQTSVGSAVVFEAPSLEAAKTLMAADPYLRENLFEHVTIEPFLVVFPEGKTIQA